MVRASIVFFNAGIFFKNTLNDFTRRNNIGNNDIAGVSSTVLSKSHNRAIRS